MQDRLRDRDIEYWTDRCFGYMDMIVTLKWENAELKQEIAHTKKLNRSLRMSLAKLRQKTQK